MPFVIYVFTISAFALGLAEFVPIGLTDVMAQGLCVGVEQTGAAVTTYALGGNVRGTRTVCADSKLEPEKCNAYNCRCVYCR